jgi:peroxiredoxin
MAALAQGVRAPEFSLPAIPGGTFSLAEALRKGPVVAAFFKVSCPVCQYTFPFLERVYQANKDSNLTVLGISQDNAQKTQAFLREFGVSFPIALDNENNYAVSNTYGITNVPTIFYIAPTGEIELSCVGWSKADVEAMNAKLATDRRQPPSTLWRPGEDVRDFRSG